MNFIAGKLVDKQQSIAYLNELPDIITDTLQNNRLCTNTVIAACDRLSSMLCEEKHIPLLLENGMTRSEAILRLSQAKYMLSSEYLNEKVLRELGPDWETPISFQPGDCATPVTERAIPVGVLLHIAAGNMDGLPFYTVIEGLLTGNINLLKLPGEDNGISLELLRLLTEIEPQLLEYVYVFEYSSEEVVLLQRLADLSDAIVVWGSDAAIAAVRRMAGPNKKLIEWGHKISFAYITQNGMDERSLRGLAKHICYTNQMLCSSCQLIYVDTDDEQHALSFCEQFLCILEDEAKQNPLTLPAALQAQIALQLRSETLQAISDNRRRVFCRNDVSVIYRDDNQLVSSIMFRNCIVKRLKREKIISDLRQSSGLLQTAGLLCAGDEREALTDLLLRAGVTRITSGEAMSDGYCGEPHDGEHSLRRYIRIASIF